MALNLEKDLSKIDNHHKISSGDRLLLTDAGIYRAEA